MQESIVQALPASRYNEDSNRHQSPSKQKGHSIQLQTKQGNQFSPTLPSSRCTRSQAAPDWTMQEILVLLNEIAAIDEDWLKQISSYQRWKMLSDSCMSMNVVRSSNQCKRKWEMLLDDYMKIKKWESQSRENSYWFLEENRRKEFGLPASFEKEVFDAMNAVIQVQEHQSNSENSDPDRIISVPEFETPYVDAASEMMTTSKSLQVEDLIMTSNSPEREDFIANPKSPTKTHALPEPRGGKELITTSALPATTAAKISQTARAMAGTLQENAEHVYAVLRGEPQHGPSHSPSPSPGPTKPSAARSEVARRQADELIGALAGLAGTLDELYDLIKTA